jgi:hypothetical protein
LLPGGDGVVMLNVTAAGAVKGAATLGDTTPVTFAAVVSASGQWPLYVPLSGGRGLLLGWVNFGELGNSDIVSEELHWQRPSGPGPLYPRGFTNVFGLDGSRYRPSGPVFDWTLGVTRLSGGNLAGELLGFVTLSGGNKFVVTSTSGLKLTLTPASGLIQGEFIHPITQSRKPLRAIVHQKRAVAGGTFAGTNATGKIFIGAQ